VRGYRGDWRQEVLVPHGGATVGGGLCIGTQNAVVNVESREEILFLSVGCIMQDGIGGLQEVGRVLFLLFHFVWTGLHSNSRVSSGFA